MIQRNSTQPIEKYDLYNKINESEIKEIDEKSCEIQESENLGYQVDNLSVSNINNTVNENKKRITFFSHQLIVAITIAIIFFVINTFTPNLYKDLINFFKEEISTQTDFKEDAKNVISIIKSSINQ